MMIDSYCVVEAKLDEEFNIVTTRVKECYTYKQAEAFKAICEELKPESKFYIEEEY
jgi:hypothetical protein